MTIEFTTDPHDRELISAIAKRYIDRAEELRAATPGGVFPPIDRMSLEMDLAACHSNGTPLDLEKLLAAPNFDFSHDVSGIRQHIDRRTGMLTGCFLPRCAKPEETATDEA